MSYQALPISTADMHHIACRLQETCFAYVVPGFFAKDYVSDIRGQFGIGFALTGFLIEIVINLRKEACPDLRVRGEPDAAAVPAEGL